MVTIHIAVVGHAPKTSAAQLESQAQGTMLFTSVASNPLCCLNGSPRENRIAVNVSYHCNGLPLYPWLRPLLPPRPLLPSAGFDRTSVAAFCCEGRVFGPSCSFGYYAAKGLFGCAQWSNYRKISKGAHTIEVSKVRKRDTHWWA